MERIASLLKRLRRSLPPTASSSNEGPADQPRRPPDEASAALGVQLGLAFADAVLRCASALDEPAGNAAARIRSTDQRDVEALRKTGFDIVDALCDAARSSSPSASFGFCQGIIDVFASSASDATAKTALLIVLPWWSLWLGQCDQAISNALLRGYAGCTYRLAVLKYLDVVTTSDAKDSTTSLLADAYAALESDADRRCLVRECIGVAFGNMMHGYDGDEGSRVARITITYLSELVAPCVLLSIGTSSGGVNRTLFWTAIIREFHLFVLSTPREYCEDAIAQFIPWLTHILHLATLRIPRQHRHGTMTGTDETFSMLLQLCEVICHISSTLDLTGERSLASTMGTVYNMILGEISPNFSGLGYSLAPVVSQLCNSLCRESTGSTKTLELPDATIFRLGLLALNEPDEKEAQRILQALYAIIERGFFDCSCGSFIIVGSLRALGYIFASSAMCNAVATKLQELASKNERNLSKMQLQKKDSLDLSVDHIVCLFGERSKILWMSELVAPTTCNGVRSTSPDEQACELLLASSLLNTNANISGTQSFSFLRRVIEQWAHLGVRALPLATASVQASAASGDSDRAISALQFLCSATAKDSICAQNVWSIVSEFTAPTSPSVVRAACIRLFVPLCKSNRKLYGRVRDTLGHAVASADTAIRIAAVATLCDLAKADLIRDVSEVIGWLQNELGDGDGTVVHYAIMSLHYLILEGELDFSKVIKVISKTLVEVDDISAILSLPPTVVEALVLLFGDGAVGTEEDSEKESDDDDSDVSPQVETAVRALFNLATTLSKHISPVADVSMGQNLSIMREDAARILQAIYVSLSRYKIDRLGFDSDTIRSTVDRSGSDLREEPSELEGEQDERYSSLQRIVMDGLVQRMQATCEYPEKDQKLIELAFNLLAFEEDALGPSLWMKRARSTSSDSKETENPQKLSKLVLKALPDASLLESQYKENPCTATAIARMYCLETASSSSATPPDDLMELLAEVSCDVKNDSSDPLFKALAAGAWVESMNSVWLSIVNFSDDFSSDAVTRVVQELCEWKHSMDQHDNALIALGAFVFAIPDRYQGTDLSNIADETCNTILEVYDSHKFAEPDAAAFALGFMGKRYARSMNLDLVRGIIGRLEGIHSFSGCYGLAMIAQVFSSSLDSMSKTDLSGKAACTIVGTIASILMSKFHSCMRKPNPRVLNLIACLKTGSGGDLDLIKSMLEVPQTDLIVEDNLRVQMKGILISLAVTLPALRHLDNDLLAAACSLVAKCPWGVGKGYVLGSAYKLQLNLPLEEMKGLYSECVDAVAGAESGAPYDDAFFAAIAFEKFLPQDEKRTGEIMSLIRRVVDGNKFTPDVRAAATLAICAHFGSVPLISENSYLYANTKKSSLEMAITSLTNMLSDANESRRCTDMAAVALGIFCRMKFPRKGVVFRPSKMVDPKTSELPLARDSTLLRKLLDSIQNSLAGDNESDQRVSLLISCIRRVPLPGDFSFLAKTSFNQVNCERGTINAAFLRLLIAQIEIERHSGSNRTEFTSLSIYVAKRPPAEFWSLFESTGGAVNQFMAATSSFLLRWPSGVIDELLTNLWSISCFEISNRRSFQSAKSLLLSIAATLQRYNIEDQSTAKSGRRKKSSGLLSPVALKSIRRLLLVEVFPSLVHIMSKLISTRNNDPTKNNDEKEEMQRNVWTSYFSCLEHIPPAVLHEDGFLPIGTQHEDVDTTVLKIYCIAHLAGSKQGEYFGSQTAREVLKANLWIARQTVSSLTVEQRTAIRISMFHLASSRSDPTSTPTDCQRDLILQSFESMLVNGLDSLALEQLAVQCGYLCRCASVSPSMSRLFTKGKIQSCGAEAFSPNIVTSIMSLFLRDLPSSLGSITTSLDMSGLVANRCLRVLTQVGCDGIPSNYELCDAAVKALKQITTCCSESESNSMQYTKFIISEMKLI